MVVEVKEPVTLVDENHTGVPLVRDAPFGILYVKRVGGEFIYWFQRNNSERICIHYVSKDLLHDLSLLNDMPKIFGDDLALYFPINERVYNKAMKLVRTHSGWSIITSYNKARELLSTMKNGELNAS